MPSGRAEIELISHQPPFDFPQRLPLVEPFDDSDSAHTDLVSQLRQLLILLQDDRERLHEANIAAFAELSQCVNTLFDRFNRLPILPEITTPTTNTVAFTNEGSGVVSIDTGQQWKMRGNIVIDTDDFTTEQRQFTTTASTTYHVRWDATNGLRYIDTTDATYNPGALPETDASFASSETDILLQKIVTDGSNVPTFTAVLNRGHYTSMVSSNSNIALENTFSGGNILLNTTGASEVVVQAPSLRVSHTGTPLIILQDTASATTAAIAVLQYQDSGQTLIGRVGFDSATDGNFEVTNNISGGDIELNTTGSGDIILTSTSDVRVTTAELFIDSAGPHFYLEDNDAASDTAIQGLISFGRTANLNAARVGFATSLDTNFEVTNNVSGGDIELSTTGTGKVGINKTDPVVLVHAVGSIAADAGDVLTASEANTNGEISSAGTGASLAFYDRGYTGGTPLAGDKYVWYSTSNIARLWDFVNNDLLTIDASTGAVDFVTTSRIEIGPVSIIRGTGSPESVHTANVGSTFHRENGGAGTSFYVKESGTGNTGWVAK